MFPDCGQATAGISRRLERIPFSGWHRRLIAILGPAHLFDAFDATSLAVVLPVLAGLWNLKPIAIGSLIAAGYIGQMAGAIAFGAMAERFGRIAIMRWALAILSFFSFACGFAGSYPILLALRTLQGLGLGAEVPLVATYVNEITSSRFRGAIGGCFQFLFAVGTVIASVSAFLIVPRFGWQFMFFLGALPLVLAIFLRRLLPESPRWLAAHGRAEEADAAVTMMEANAFAGREIPVPGADDRTCSISELQEHSGLLRVLLGRKLMRRTLSAWLLAFCCSLVGYGIVGWMPTVYRSVYKLPVKTALLFSTITGLCSLVGAGAGILLIDRLGRKTSMAIGFCGASVALSAMTQLGANTSASIVMVLASIALGFLALPLSGIYVYGPEIYPTGVRAVGMGVIGAWLRIGSIVGPSLVGLILTFGNIVEVFSLFTGAAILGAIGALVLMVETKIGQSHAPPPFR